MGSDSSAPKRVQVYPTDLCRRRASAITACGDPNAATFNMVTPAAHRKRPLGQAVPWAIHRQAETGAKALAAGYQLKRSVLPPLLAIEYEPGEAVRVALDLIHPFSTAPALDPDLQEALALTALHPEQSSFPPLPGLALLGAAGTSAVAADGPAAEADP